MIWTTIYNGGDFKVEINFAGGIYKRIPSLIRVTNVSNTNTVISLNVPTLGFSANYVFDANNEILIDFSDIGIVAEMGTQYAATIAGDVSSNVITFNFTAVGLVSPNDVFIPKPNGIWETQPTISNQLIAPIPSRWLISPASPTPFEYVEIYAMANVNGLQFITNMHVNIVAGRNNIQYNALAVGGAIRNTNDNTAIRIYRQQPICGREYAVVQWVSRFGGIKRHVWEVRGITEKVTGKTNFATIDGSYKQLKGSEAGFKLRLDNLTAFDYWYYADIITSDDVRVWLCAESNLHNFDDETRVEVSTNDYTLPTPAEKGELVVNVNWKKYKQL